MFEKYFVRGAFGGLLAVMAVVSSSKASGEENPPRKTEPCVSPPSMMACIPGGPFIRGTNDGPPDTRPEQVVFLDTFYMDIYEVTYSEYQSCAKQGQCRKAGPNYRDFNGPKQPITGVNWYDAVNYCRVHGMHLPTEAEWEKAARGADGERYPWGNEPATCERAIIKNRAGRSCGVQKKGKHGEKGRPFDVGSRPASRYGLFDMSGNSWEWVYDWYSKSYGECGKDCDGIAPKGPCGGEEPCPGHTRKVVRGGSWYWEAIMATGFYRRSHGPKNSPFHHFGFRCAASPDEARRLLKAASR